MVPSQVEILDWFLKKSKFLVALIIKYDKSLKVKPKFLNFFKIEKNTASQKGSLWGIQVSGLPKDTQEF